MRVATGLPGSVPTSLPWPDDEVSRFAFRCHAYGAGEGVTSTLLRSLDRQGVRSLGRYTDRWSDDDLTKWLSLAETVQAQEVSRYGSLLRPRLPRRWPWRTSTSQAGW